MMFRLFALALTVFIIGPAALADQIVLVGDSLTCGPYGKNLVAELDRKGHDVHLFCTVSSAASHWRDGKNPKGMECQTMTSAKPRLVPCDGTGKTPTLKSLLERFPKARFMVGLGTNSLGSPVADKAYLNLAEELERAKVPCTWVGPPHLSPAQARGFSESSLRTLEKNLDAFYESLHTKVSKSCDLIDSRDITAQGAEGSGTVDGVHRNEAAGAAWARMVASTHQGAPTQGATKK